VDIVCATDTNYLPHCAAMLTSLMQHASRSDLRVYLVLDRIDPEVYATAIPHLQNLLPYLCVLQADIAPIRDFPVNGHASVATYFRLLLPGLLPAELKRVIFIDSDAIVNSSLTPLWNLPMEGKALAAVPDHWLSCRDHGYVHGEYFNAGIMLIDLQRWRQVDILGRGAAFAKANPDRLRHWDQDVLNHVFKNDWLPIGERWNACPHLFGLLPDFSLDPTGLTASERHAIADPAIIHFAGPGPVKPWNAACPHPWRELYRQAKALTPWAATPLDNRPAPRWQRAWTRAVFEGKCLLRSLMPQPER
jgi:lipopolysaccharide biosynthesis glycosyltransferase